MEDALRKKVVLKNVLKYTAPKDLAAHRLVCRKWRNALLSRWRSTAILNVIPSQECRQLEEVVEVEVEEGATSWIQRVKPVKGITLWELYEEMGIDDNKISWRKNPFLNYRLKYWDLKKGELWDTIFPEFWFRVGGQMKTLWLDHCNFHNGTPEILREILHIYARNLEGLTLTCNTHLPHPVDLSASSRSGSNSNYSTMHVFLKRLRIDGYLDKYGKLFDEFPNLEMVTVSNVWSMTEIDEMARSMARVSCQLKHLDCIHSGHHPGHHSLPILHQRFLGDDLDSTFPLEYLAVPISESCRAIDLANHLQRHANTLKTLKIFRDPFTEAFNKLIFYKSMPELTELELFGNVVKNICFLQWMPNLKKLTVNLAAFEMRKQITERLNLEKQNALLLGEDARNVVPFRHDILRETVERGMDTIFPCLETFSIDFEFDIPSLNILKTFMPNLKCLRTILNNVTLREVYALWPDLEELECLFGSRVDDVGITGLVPDPDYDYDGGKLPSISSFTCLKRFKLKAFCAAGRITDFSCEEGFLRLNCLQSLELWVCNSCVKIVRNSSLEHKSENLECCELLDFELACKRDPFVKSW